MSVLIWLSPVAIAMGGLGLLAFMWSLKSGQFDDLDGAAHRILIDEDGPITDRPAQEDQAEAVADGEGVGEKSR